MRFHDLYPITVNDMYVPTVSAPDSTGKRHGFLRKSNELWEFQEKFSSELSKYDEEIKLFIDRCNEEYDHLGFKLIILLGMPKSDLFYKRKSDDLRPNDTSNFLKSIEDVIASYTHKDDKYNIEIMGVKYRSEEESWGFTVILLPVDYMKYDYEYVKERFLNEN